MIVFPDTMVIHVIYIYIILTMMISSPRYYIYIYTYYDVIY